MQRAGYLVELVETSYGVRYFRNIKDENGKKIKASKEEPLAFLEPKDKKVKKEKKSRLSKESFKLEEVITARGTKYYRFAHDADGKKIPLTEIEKDTQTRKLSEKGYKRVGIGRKDKTTFVPKDIAIEMLQMMEAKKNIRCGEFFEKGRDWRVVLTNEDWLLVHMTSTLGENKWGFFNPKRNISAPFDITTHTGGNSNIKWPESV